MDLLEFLLGGGPVANPPLTLLSLLAAVSLNLGVLIAAIRFLRRTGQGNNAEGLGWLLALNAAMSFILYKHHPYDEVMFLFPLCYVLSRWRRPAAACALLIIVYNWYFARFVDSRITWSFAWAEARLCLFIGLLVAVYAAKPDKASSLEAIRPSSLAARCE